MDKFEAQLGREQGARSGRNEKLSYEQERKHHVEAHPAVDKIRQQIVKLTDGPETPAAQKKYAALRGKEAEVRKRITAAYDKLKAAKATGLAAYDKKYAKQDAKVAASGGFDRGPMKPDHADLEDEKAASAKKADSYDRMVGAGKYANQSREERQRGAVETGARGGKFYVSSSGSKVYVK